MGKYVYAFGFGWVIYMIGVLFSAFEGVLSLFVQPIVALFASFVFTLFTGLFGQIFRIQKLYNAWKDYILFRYTIWAIGLILLFFPKPFGHYLKLVDSTTDKFSFNIPFAPFMLGYFLIIFTVAHWPVIQPPVDTHDTD